jgi:TonB family protein
MTWDLISNIVVSWGLLRRKALRKRIVLGAGSLRIFFVALLLTVADSAAAATPPSGMAPYEIVKSRVEVNSAGSFQRANEMHFRMHDARRTCMNLWGTNPSLHLVMKQEDFPPGAWDRHEEGTEEVLLMVEPTGAIAKFTVRESSGYDDLDDAAQVFLTNPGTITPPTVNGRPAASHIRVKIEWSVKPHADRHVLHA